MSEGDWRNQIKAILQYKMGLSFGDSKIISDEDLAVEFGKYQYVMELKKKATINVENEIKKNG